VAHDFNNILMAIIGYTVLARDALTMDSKPALYLQEAIKAADLGAHYADHDRSLYWVNAAGVPWVAAYVSATGDPIADLHENMAAEQKARAVYENLLRLSDDPLVNDTLRWLREREVVHFQRFGETLMYVQEYLDLF
jgi:spore coat protein JC